MRKLTRRLTIPLYTIVALALVAPRVVADDVKRQDIYQQTLRAAVWIKSAKGSGSGFVADHDRKLIVTAAQIADVGASVDVFFPAFKDGKLICEKGHYQ